MLLVLQRDGCVCLACVCVCVCGWIYKQWQSKEMEMSFCNNSRFLEIEGKQPRDILQAYLETRGLVSLICRVLGTITSEKEIIILQILMVFMSCDMWVVL